MWERSLTYGTYYVKAKVDNKILKMSLRGEQDNNGPFTFMVL